jgi:macrodomain Ter protein organizer (MatP/YcbG family)
MARPKTIVNNDNYLNIHIYLREAFKDFRLFKEKDTDEVSDLFFKAEQDFKALPAVKHKNKASQAVAYTALQRWIDAYLSADDWSRCLAAIRQHKFHHRQKLKTIKVPWEIYWDITQYAKKIDSSLVEAIAKAVRKELST